MRFGFIREKPTNIKKTPQGLGEEHLKSSGQYYKPKQLFLKIYITGGSTDSDFPLRGG